MSPLRVATSGATGLFSSPIGIPRLAIRVGAAASTIIRCHQAGNKTRHAARRNRAQQLNCCATVRCTIVAARVKLATTRDLPEEARQALWAVVGSRLWFLEMVTQVFDQQLEQIAQSLETDLAA